MQDIWKKTNDTQHVGRISVSARYLVSAHRLLNHFCLLFDSVFDFDPGRHRSRPLQDWLFG